jgi:hypothetical protein
MAVPSAPPVHAAPPPPAAEAASTLIGGTYAVDTTRLLPGAAGGLSAFVAIDRRGGDIPLMAVQVRPHAPARAAAIQMLLANPVEGILGPIAHGPARGPAGEMAWFVICPAPSGPPLWSAPQGGTAAMPARPWGEPGAARMRAPSGRPRAGAAVIPPPYAPLHPPRQPVPRRPARGDRPRSCLGRAARKPATGAVRTALRGHVHPRRPRRGQHRR